MLPFLVCRCSWHLCLEDEDLTNKGTISRTCKRPAVPLGAVRAGDPARSHPPESGDIWREDLDLLPDSLVTKGGFPPDLASSLPLSSHSGCLKKPRPSSP
ncbi:hypothetical protein H1C71_014938 [Ictidomys tridecemlineatus]|nr:hypothetical protein H1C71_014938 [Ictidomys tridecemlineatus]